MTDNPLWMNATDAQKYGFVFRTAAATRVHSDDRGVTIEVGSLKSNNRVSVWVSNGGRSVRVFRGEVELKEPTL